MFTIEQIKIAHSKVKSGADFPTYIQDLIKLGVTRYETYVEDGHALFFGDDDDVVSREPSYPAIPIHESSSGERLKDIIHIHQQGQTDYPTFCVQAAEAGVEKWITHMAEMTVTYLDKQGTVMTVEPIPISG